VESATAPAADGAAVASDGHGDDERPLGAYAALTAGFAVTAAGGLAAARVKGVSVQERIGGWEIVTAGIASQRVSRHLTRSKTTGFVRAPFTRHRGASGGGEVDEIARGTGLRRALGELLTCPYCIGTWVSAAFVIGLIVAPRATRLLAALFTVESLADFVQLAYGAARRRT
jgi:Protein of unknown function (DUF1360)